MADGANALRSKRASIRISDRQKKELENFVFEFLESNERETSIKDLSNEERRYLHMFAQRKNLKSVSRGALSNRILYLIRKIKVNKEDEIAPVDTTQLRLNTQSLIGICGTTINSTWKQERSKSIATPEHYTHVNKRFTFGEPSIPGPPKKINDVLLLIKRQLPIFRFKKDILRMIDQNSVFILKGETGSGKSTQLPQYILEDATINKMPCRIIVTQPRRVAAVSVSSRVADERGETLGNTVGYHIRMEKKFDNSTSLLYTTSGCFLRLVMGNRPNFFKSITHLIIDEIHERDKYTDFTLIIVKEQLKKYPDLKVILMSATMDIDLLSNYFDRCSVLEVPGQSYQVNNHYLEDILYNTGYTTKVMQAHLSADDDISENEYFEYRQEITKVDDETQCIYDRLVDEIDEIDVANDGEIMELFAQLQYYIESEGMSIEISHKETGVTPLMMACKYNLPQYVRVFLQFNPIIERVDYSNMTAATYATYYDQCLAALYNSRIPPQRSPEEIRKQRLLYAYQQDFSDDSDVDHNLILSLIENLYRNGVPGGIMVFLPGYNNIIQMRDLLIATLPQNKYIILILHGQMETQDQAKAMQNYYSMRKIILSTNIGQTSLTIPDLTYVIDSGKVKMNTFDSITESSKLQSVWISQADADQRSGRAGRTQNGVCFRIYSSARYKQMPAYNVPEIVRVPLTEICLYAKTLAGNTPVQTYLKNALNPPSSISIQNALRKLKILKVMNDDESITELGRHLVVFPLDVQLGICLLYGVFYRCIDSILTIVSYHSVKDPFILPSDRSKQGQASFARKKFSEDTFSDQMGILNLFAQYKAIRNNKKLVREFCYDNFLSQPAMEMMFSIRHQIYDLLKSKFYNLNESKLYNKDKNMIRLCLVASFYPNIAMINRTRNVLCSKESTLLLQRTSALTPPGRKNIKDFIDELPFDWVVYYEKIRLEQICSINMNTLIPGLIMALSCGHEQSIEVNGIALGDEICECSSDEEGQQSEPDTTYSIIIDKWINISFQNNHHGETINSLRCLLQKRFKEFISGLAFPGSILEIKLVNDILQNEFP